MSVGIVPDGLRDEIPKMLITSFSAISLLSLFPIITSIGPIRGQSIQRKCLPRFSVSA